MPVPAAHARLRGHPDDHGAGQKGNGEAGGHFFLYSIFNEQKGYPEFPPNIPIGVSLRMSL